MRQMKNSCIGVVVLLIFFFTRPVYAYIDPGSGSLILQTALGIAFGGLYATKLYWRQILAFFRKARARKPASERPPQ